MKTTRFHVTVAVLLVALCLAPMLDASTIAFGYKPQKGLGSQVFLPVASTALVLPGLTKHAIINVRGGGCYLTEDSTVPSAANGVYLPCGTLILVQNDATYLGTLRFLQADGTVTVSVSYSGDR